MRRIVLALIFFGLFPGNEAVAAPAPCLPADASSRPPAIALTPLLDGLSSPVGVTHAGDGSGRLFIIEQQGRILIVKNGVLQPTPFLELGKRVTFGGERGLLGLAFHPKFSANGRFFVNFTGTTDEGLQTFISEFRIDPKANRANAIEERVLLTVAQPYANHNGGHLAFGPDGYLYIGLGDGGSGNDPHDNGQKLSTLLGKMLRIDVDRQADGKAYAIPADNPFVGRKEAAPEIWAYGFRNPWRYAFDAASGRLYVGDVGQRAREEINRVEKGRNYGWRIMEGHLCTPGIEPNCNKKGLIPPIADYPRSEGTVVVAGTVYRGRAIPALCGVYLFGDFGTGRIWGLRDSGTKISDRGLLLEPKVPISSFGEDEEREVYVVDYSGKIFKLTAAKPSP